jgi:plastocyanin domain-containing protein
VRPFTRTEVTRYLLWIVLGLSLIGILAWYIFLSPGHEQIRTSPPAATADLILSAPHSVLRSTS